VQNNIKIGSLVSLHGEMGVVIDVFDNTGIGAFIAEVEWMGDDTGEIVHAYEYVSSLKLEE
jgi:hypothetical protein